MIICADIHGRTFWKDAVAKKRENEKIIFLGDYLEPYPQEGITHDMAFQNFLKIIDYKKSHMDDCVLLLGNHDFACIDKSMISCRHDYMNEIRNKKTFIENMDLFDLIYSMDIGDRKFVFSHSGIHKQWFDESVQKDGMEDGEMPWDFLNRKFKEDYKSLLGCLGIYSKFRGWTDVKYGSCIWADCREWSIEEPDYENVYQIFGHTMLIDKPVILKHWANLDCKKPFRLDEETGELINLEDI